MERNWLRVAEQHYHLIDPLHPIHPSIALLLWRGHSFVFNCMGGCYCHSARQGATCIHNVIEEITVRFHTNCRSAQPKWFVLTNVYLATLFLSFLKCEIRWLDNVAKFRGLRFVYKNLKWNSRLLHASERPHEKLFSTQRFSFPATVSHFRVF